MHEVSGRWRILLGAIVASTLVLLACAPLASGTFTADDYDLFQVILRPDQPNVVAWNRVWAEFFAPWSEQGDRPFFRPIATLARACVVALFGVDASALHVVNLGLHAAIVFLVATIAGFLLRTRSGFTAALAGLLFGLHPATVESVAWIADLPTLLATVAMLLAVVFHSITRGRVLVVACTLLAIGSKEIGWLTPVLLTVVDHLRQPAGPRRIRMLVARQTYLLPWLLWLFAWRIATVGLFPSSRLSGLLAPWLESLYANVPRKLALSFDPCWTSLSGPWSPEDWLHLGFVVGACTFLVLGLRSVWYFVGWMGLLAVVALVPGMANLVGAEWSGSRVLYVAVIPVAWLFASLRLSGSQALRLSGSQATFPHPAEFRPSRRSWRSPS